MSTVIILLAYGYLEYGRAWDGRSFYRRTVDYREIVWC